MVKHIYQQYNSLKEGEKEYLELNPHHAIAIKEAKDVAFFSKQNLALASMDTMIKAMHFVIVFGLRC